MKTLHIDLSSNIKRYIYWEKERPLINKEINEYLSSCSEDEIEYLFQDGFADPSVDPTFLFDIKHPFPGVKLITERLKKLGICNSLLHEQKNDSKITYFNLSESHYYDHKGKLETTVTYSIKGKAIKKGKTKEEHINEEISVKFSVLPCLPIVEDYNGSQSPADYYSEKGVFPVSFHFLPGISINELSENFCEYLALRKIENWVIKNLNQ